MLAGWWSYATQREAMRAEAGFKRLTRAEKLSRLAQDRPEPRQTKQPGVHKESRSGASRACDLGIVGNG